MRDPADHVDPASLNVGDPITYTTRAHYGPRCVEATITRVTTTQIVADNGVRFHRRTGRRVGDHWYELVAFDGPAARRSRVMVVRDQLAATLANLGRQQIHDRGDLLTFLDRLAAVVAECRARVDAIEPGTLATADPA